MFRNDFEILIDTHMPPTLFSLCESICYTNNTPSRISNIAKNTRATIFEFDYPLSEKVDKEQFEINIINHFLMRRICTETFTSFQLMLNSKLNEIMPFYNKLFDALEDWKLFESGELTERTLEAETTSEGKSKSQTRSNNELDKRFSDMPDNQIANVKSGSYLSNYGFDTSNTSSNDEGETEAKSNSTNVERITRTPADKLSIYKEFINEQNNIFKKLYAELDTCFYQLCDG